MLLIIDNYDSFTWNIVHAAARACPMLAGPGLIRVVRNDEINSSSVMTMHHGVPPTHIILSPGPCTPGETGACKDIVRVAAGRVPILGVCLGHQTIGEVFGMRVVRAPAPVHGSTSMIEHNGKGIFCGIASPMTAARYHSLIIDKTSIPARDSEGVWEVSAWTREHGVEVVMGLRRVWNDSMRAPLEGVQFHPESFMTPCGEALLRNFLTPLASTTVPAGRFASRSAHEISRYIAIDLGDKRTGLAVADAQTRVVAPAGVVEVPLSRDHGVALIAALAQKITSLADERALLIVGLPFNMDGTPGPAAAKARAFAERLAHATGLRFVMHDERLTTAAADDKLARSGLTRDQKKVRRDAIAAAAILADYLGTHGTHTGISGGTGANANRLTR